MANAIVTVKVMPVSPEVDLADLEVRVKKVIEEFNGETETKTEIEPIAFGLKALKIIFVMDEKLGAPDAVSEKIDAFEDVNSAEIVDVRRALG